MLLLDVVVTDNVWHNITLYRRGATATLEVMTDNRVVGSITSIKGTHQLLDSNGMIFIGGIMVDNLKDDTKIADDYEGKLFSLL